MCGNETETNRHVSNQAEGVAAPHACTPFSRSIAQDDEGIQHTSDLAPQWQWQWPRNSHSVIVHAALHSALVSCLRM